MIALVVAHLVVAAGLAVVSGRWRRAAFGIAAVVPAATLVWALLQLPAALGAGLTETVAWAPALGLALSFRLDALALAMIVLVSGIGALVLVYSAGYFSADAPDAPRSSALLLGFAGVMLGLVLADDLLTMYVFWELTSIASFLLVGQSGAEPAERRAAVQALLVTVLGGLAMLLGFVLLGEAAGTYRISEIVASPPRGPLVTAALVLILLGVLTKSAQLPFHPWLPAAMVAPTPISAYLHAAAMVKAGVYLVARLAPGFAELAVFWVPVVGFGLATMLVGGWRALAETDLKRLLAFGTVSQLGFLMALFGASGRFGGVAALAGVAILLAHGLFKAPLFLVVGAIDHATGTRDLRELTGLGRALPGLAGVAALAAASMAGLPPTLGFVGKEAAFEAFLHAGPRGLVVAVGLLVGSVLTAAYSARFLWGAFARKPGVRAVSVHRPGALLAGPAAVCAVTGLALGAAARPLVDPLAGTYGGAFPRPDEQAAAYHLALWHGLTPALLFAALALGGGLVVHAGRRAVRVLAHRTPPVLDAQLGYEAVVAGLERGAVGVTGRLQVGSLPAYLSTILAVVVLLPGIAVLLAGQWPSDQPIYHAPMQVPLAGLVLAAAVALPRARRRFSAVLLVGVIGYGVGGLFIVEGAPDLALAQFLVETLSLVAFVLVLRRLPAHFTEAPSARRVQVPKALVAAFGGAIVAGLAVVLSGARQLPPTASAEYLRLAPTEAGATNVVSAILVDFRAMDTLGEISVLFVTAAGVASLVLATRYDRRAQRRVDSGQGSPRHEEDILG